MKSLTIAHVWQGVVTKKLKYFWGLSVCWLTNCRIEIGALSRASMDKCAIEHTGDC